MSRHLVFGRVTRLQLGVDWGLRVRQVMRSYGEGDDLESGQVVHASLSKRVTTARLRLSR